MPKEAKQSTAKTTRKATPQQKTDNSRKKRPKKDPNQPKRGLSAYMFFSQDWRERVKNENPDASFGTIGKLLGEKWKGMSEKDKGPYNDMAAKDKKRYESEKAAYDKGTQPADDDEEEEEDDSE